MVSSPLVLERPIDALIVGARLRQDLGDLDELVESIRRLGILEPLVITPAGVLICGARRLEAARRAGLTMAKVTVNPRISTRLEEVLAELHENTLRKPLTHREGAALYAELLAIETHAAAERQELSRFGAPDDNNGGDDSGSDGAGGGTVPPPAVFGKARERAARAITGKDSYHTFDRVLAIEALAEDESQEAAVRDVARRALEALDDSQPVARNYQQAKSAEALARLHQLTEDPTLPAAARAMAQETLLRLEAEPSPRTRLRDATRALTEITRAGTPARSGRSGWGDLDETTQTRGQLLRFTGRLTDAAAWWSGFDPETVGRTLDDEAWDALESLATSLAAFHRAALEARRTRPDPTAGWD